MEKKFVLSCKNDLMEFKTSRILLLRVLIQNIFFSCLTLYLQKAETGTNK